MISTDKNDFNRRQQIHVPAELVLRATNQRVQKSVALQHVYNFIAHRRVSDAVVPIGLLLGARKQLARLS
jgi:hypothetical protein